MQRRYVSYNNTSNWFTQAGVNCRLIKTALWPSQLKVAKRCQDGQIRLIKTDLALASAEGCQDCQGICTCFWQSSDNRAEALSSPRRVAAATISFRLSGRRGCGEVWVRTFMLYSMRRGGRGTVGGRDCWRMAACAAGCGISARRRACDRVTRSQRGHGPQPKQGNRQDAKSAKTANSTRQAGTAPVKDRVADVGRQGICAAREEIEPL
jgi:hypothetical protein